MSMYTNADDVRASIAADVQTAVDRAQKAQQFQGELSALRGTATSDGISATVDASGGLLELSLPRDLSYRSGTDLARSILAVVRSAYADVAGQAAQAAADAFGGDSPVTGRMREELDRRATILANDPGEAGPSVLR